MHLPEVYRAKPPSVFDQAIIRQSSRLFADVSSMLPVIEQSRTGDLTFLVTDYGKPHRRGIRWMVSGPVRCCRALAVFCCDSTGLKKPPKM